MNDIDELRARRGRALDDGDDDEVDRVDQLLVDAGAIPEWVHHVGREDVTREQIPGEFNVNRQIAWCGVRPSTLEFTFVDATHALIHAAQDGRMQICPECASALASALANGTYERPTQEE